MLKILFNIIKKNKGAVIALALLTFVSAATSLITPYLSGTFIDILAYIFDLDHLTVLSPLQI